MRLHRFVFLFVTAGAVVVAPTGLRAQDVPLSQVLAYGEDWQNVGGGYQSLEGAAANRQGAIYFADKAANRIYRISPSGLVEIFAERTGGTKALMFGPDDRLYAAQSTARRIVSYAEGGESEVIAANVDVEDLVVAGDGSIWFSDSVGGRIGYISPDRSTPRYVRDNLHPDGLTLAHREGTLVVTDAVQPYLWAFRIELDGSLTAPAPAFAPLRIPFGEIVPSSGSVMVDTRDRVFVTSAAGLQMFDTEDRFSGVIESPLRGKRITSATFGGEDFSLLYVTLEDQILRLKTATSGIPFFARDYDDIYNRGGRGGGAAR